jgi:hypothetical protein
MSSHKNQQIIKAKAHEFVLPLIRDGLVVGRNAPIGCVALRKALDLLTAFPFEHIPIEDDIIQDILVRQALLRRIPRDRLLAFVLRHIKPAMGAEEIMQLEISVEMLIEESGE